MYYLNDEELQINYRLFELTDPKFVVSNTFMYFGAQRD